MFINNIFNYGCKWKICILVKSLDFIILIGLYFVGFKKLFIEEICILRLVTVGMFVLMFLLGGWFMVFSLVDFVDVECFWIGFVVELGGFCVIVFGESGDWREGFFMLGWEICIG